MSNLLAIFQPSHYTRLARGVAQLAAHRVWDAGVGGSSPPTPTNNRRFYMVGGFSIQGGALRSPNFRDGYFGSDCHLCAKICIGGPYGKENRRCDRSSSL